MERWSCAEVSASASVAFEGFLLWVVGFDTPPGTPTPNLLIKRLAKSYIISLHLGVKLRVRVVCDAGRAKYLDTQNNTWIKRDIDFAKAETIGIFGISTKVIPKDDLLEYKSRVNREVDIIDIEQIANNT